MAALPAITPGPVGESKWAPAAARRSKGGLEEEEEDNHEWQGDLADNKRKWCPVTTYRERLLYVTDVHFRVLGGTPTWDCRVETSRNLDFVLVENCS